MASNKFERISPEDLPGLLSRLAREEVTEFALVGPEVGPEVFSSSSCGLQVVFQLVRPCAFIEPPEGILKLKGLAALVLRDLGLHDIGAQLIAEHLGQLTSLDLSDNQVGAAGAQSIAEHLGQLASLNLSNNQVGAAGAQSIAEHFG